MLFNTKQNLVFPLEKHFLFIFSVSLSFSLSLFWPPFFFLFLFLCLSLDLVLVSSFLCLFFVFFFFLSLSFLFCFCFMKGTTSKNSIANFLFINLFFWGGPYFSFQVSLLFPDFKLCFFVQHKCFWFQNKQLKKKQNFFDKWGVATKRFFFYQPVFLQNVKSYPKCQKLSIFCPFLGKFWVMFKKHDKNRYLSTFLKTKN